MASKIKNKFKRAKVISLFLIMFLVLLVWMAVNCFTDDFFIEYSGNKYKVIVEKPNQKMEKYPLIIYHHGVSYESIEQFELNEIANGLVKEGFLVWIPERFLWSPKKSLETILEAEGISKEILEMAVNHPEVDKNNINVVGFDIGSWAMLTSYANSSDIKKMVLIEFGGYFEDMLMYQYVKSLVEDIEYEYVKPSILIMVVEEDEKIDLNQSEILRKRLVESDKTVDVMQYSERTYKDLMGNKPYLEDIIKYLKGEKIDTSEHININMDIIKKWKRIWETGYW